MAVKKGNTRIIFTTSKAQAQWLKNRAEIMHISVSALLRFIIRTSTGKYISTLSDHEREMLFEIAQDHSWVDDDDD